MHEENTMERRKTVVVTDSAAYLPDDALAGLDIPVIPLWLIWDDGSLRDGVDIDPQTFYRRLKDAPTLPTTSQPSTGEFERFYRDVAESADTIVSIHVSSKISGTVDSALAARGRLPELDIRVVDSLSCSMGMGFAVLAAAQAANAGQPADEVVAAAEAMKRRTHVLFVVDTLEYLRRGGRIGGARWLLGMALQIKPILELADGQIASLSQARTNPKAIAQMLDLIEKRLAGAQMVQAAIVDVDCDEAGRVAELVHSRFGPAVVYRTPISPAVGSHVGPGTIGVAFYT
jgi:DegV family protein with EDD domain